jgi:hypothetical protein
VASRVAFDEHDEDWVLAVVVDSVHHLQVGEVLLLELKSYTDIYETDYQMVW